MKNYQRFGLLFSTIRHLTVAQIWHRSHRTIRRRWWKTIAKHPPQPAQCQLALHCPLYAGLPEIAQITTWADEIGSAIEHARSVSDQRFYFLQRSVSFSHRIGWHDPEFSQLWRYHLHYFDYIRDILIWGSTSERVEAYRAFRWLALSWIENNRVLLGDGWHPYTISLRVVNWLHACSFFDRQLKDDEETSDLLLRSLYGQVRVLFSDLELDVRGNHLLENIRALIWAGCAFAGSEAKQWFERGLHLLQVEVAEQVLSDGGHFERSPGYHLVVFKDLLEIALWLQRNKKLSLTWLDDALRRMREYLWAILSPDERVPLLKDTVWDATPDAQDLLAACAIYFDEPSYKCGDVFGLYPALLFGTAVGEKFESWPMNNSPRGSVALRASAHYVIRDEDSGDYLILDAGKPCPDYLPAHAHADLLTFELSVAGQRIVVDSGVYEYTAGPWRDYFRSTRAHNNVEVSGENQSEVWSSFRVGRRARPGPVSWQAHDSYVLVQSEHDGYRRLPVPVVHQRTIVCQRGQFWLVVDQLWGRGHVDATNHVHLHPELSINPTNDSSWQILHSRVPLWLTPFGEFKHSVVKGQMEPLRQGWYSERFGQLQSNSVFILQQQASLPLCYGYAISRSEPAQVHAATLSSGHEITITFQTRHHTLRLVRHESPHFA